MPRVAGGEGLLCWGRGPGRPARRRRQARATLRARELPRGAPEPAAPSPPETCRPAAPRGVSTRGSPGAAAPRRAEAAPRG